MVDYMKSKYFSLNLHQTYKIKGRLSKDIGQD